MPILKLVIAGIGFIRLWINRQAIGALRMAYRAINAAGEMTWRKTWVSAQQVRAGPIFPPPT